MATGGGPNRAFVEATGSDAVFDHVCGPCSDEQTKEAVGVCVVCEDWLCDECFRAHKKSKASKQHDLMTVEEVKNSDEELAIAADKCTERCGRHDSEFLNFFCRKHNYLGCSKCLIKKHRYCSVRKIPDISQDTAVKTEFKQTKVDLEYIEKQSNQLATDVRKKIALVKQNNKELLTAFRKYKKDLVESLDKIEVGLEETCSKNEIEETKRLEKIAESCEELGKSSSQTKGQFEVYEDRGQHCNMFVATKRARNKVNTMRDNIREARGSSGVAFITFQPNLKVGEILKSPEGMGTLVADRSDTDYSKIQAKHFAHISILSEGDGTCTATGFALLPSHKLVLTDCTNSEVKVIDTSDNKMLSIFKLDGHPWGICKISYCSVAVTVFQKEKLVFLSVNSTGELATTKTICVSGRCFGIATTDDRLIVTYGSPDKMEIMDMDGSVLQTFKTDHQGEQLFVFPRNVGLSADKKSVYVSNTDNNTVTCMSLDGTVTAIYKDDRLCSPEQTAVDSNGMVFVSGMASNNVHLITPDFKKIKVVLNLTNLVLNIFAVSYCAESNRLYIGMNCCDIIKVFQLV